MFILSSIFLIDSLFSGQIALNGSAASINNQKQLYFNGKVEANLNNNALQLNNSIDYSIMSRNKTNIANDFYLKFQPRFIKPNYSFFSYYQFSKIKSRLILDRSEFGIGGGFYVVKKDSFKVTSSSAILYDRTKYSNMTITNFRYSHRVQLNITFRKFSYSYEAFYQPLFKDFSNFNYSIANSLKTKIKSNIYANVQFNSNYEFFIAPNTSKKNSFSSIGLIFKYN